MVYYWRVRRQFYPDSWSEVRHFTTLLATDTRTETPPLTLRLHGNYPNPFRASTSIRFDLPQPTPVRLDVYNAVGARVATVVDGTLPPGRHAVTWESDSLPAGLYVYRLQAGGETVTRTMVLVR